MAGKHPRADKLAKLACIVSAITAQQKDHPEYGRESLESIVGDELKKLLEETARSKEPV